MMMMMIDYVDCTFIRDYLWCTWWCDDYL